MAKLAKKSKEEKISEIGKIQENLQKYDTILFVENNDIQNTCLQSLRSLIDGKVMIIKKNVFQKTYLNIIYPQNYFIIFTKQSELPKIMEFQYSSYLKKGEAAPQAYVIKAGVIKQKRLAELVSPTEQKGANTILIEDYIVCEEGDILTDKQAEIMKIKNVRSILRNLNILDIKNSEELESNKE